MHVHSPMKPNVVPVYEFQIKRKLGMMTFERGQGSKRKSACT